MVSCLEQLVVFFQPVSSSTQQRPAPCPEWGWDAFLTLHLDLRMSKQWHKISSAHAEHEVSFWKLRLLFDSIQFASNVTLHFQCFLGNNQYPVLPFRAHTLLVFFNKIRSHWARMSIHLASLCLTNSGAGPTLLRRDRVDNSQLIRWLLRQTADLCLHLFLCCHYRKAVHSKSRKETGKPHGSSFTSPWQQVRMSSMRRDCR